jgi:hypothetical protein
METGHLYKERKNMAEAAKTTTDNVNQTLDRRRAEQAAEHFTQENVRRMSEISATGAEIFHKSLGMGAEIAHYWGDALVSMQNMTKQVISTAHKELERRAS